jgi:hypothetical protein
VCSPLPLVGSLIAHPKTRATTLGGSAGTPPRIACPGPPRTQLDISAIKSQILDDLMGRPPEFFPTHACDIYSPIGKSWHIYVIMNQK